MSDNSIDYRELDSCLVNGISFDRTNPHTDSFCVEAARKLVEKHGGKVAAYISRRLQVLREMGLVHYLKKAEAPNNKAGWYETPDEPRDHW